MWIFIPSAVGGRFQLLTLFWASCQGDIAGSLNFRSYSLGRRAVGGLNILAGSSGISQPRGERMATGGVISERV